MREVLINLQEGCERTRENSIASENNYKRTLETVNARVETFNTSYKPLLKRLHDNDIDYCEHFKMTMLKFGGMILNSGSQLGQLG